MWYLKVKKKKSYQNGIRQQFPHGSVGIIDNDGGNTLFCTLKSCKENRIELRFTDARTKLLGVVLKKREATPKIN